MWTWLVVVLAFFSVPESKPAGYAMPLLFPIAWLVADAIVATRAGVADKLPRRIRASVIVAVAICIAAVAGSRFVRGRDDTEIATALARSRADGEPVVFFGEYFFDVPFLADLREPVPVVADWHDPTIFERDTWQRELIEGASFRPALSKRLLVEDVASAAAASCGAGSLWVVARGDGARVAAVASLPAAKQVAAADREVSLWRVPCTTIAGGHPVPP